MLNRLLILLVTPFLLIGCDKTAQANTLQEMDSFYEVAQQAQRDNLPIMIMFSAEHCGFCIQLKREVLDPMMRNGMYDGKVMYMRQVSLDMHSPMQFSATETIEKRAFASMYRADITPTIIFVDSRGLPIADRLVGVFDTQLYAGMIHRSLNQAYEKLGNPLRLPATPEQMQANQ